MSESEAKRNKKSKYPAVINYMTHPEAHKIIDFLKEAFGFEQGRLSGKPEENVIFHCELTLDDSVVMIATHANKTISSFCIYNENVDAAYEKALKAGALSKQEPKMEIHGDRSAIVTDSWGNEYCIHARMEELSKADIQKRKDEGWDPAAVKPKVHFKSPHCQTVVTFLRSEKPKEIKDFLEEKLDFKQEGELFGDDTTIFHVEERFEDSIVFVGVGAPTATNFYISVKDVDATYKKAIEAGAISVSAPEDKFYGDRMAEIKDSMGQTYWIATYVKDVPEEEMTKMAEEYRQKENC